MKIQAISYRTEIPGGDGGMWPQRRPLRIDPDCLFRRAIERLIRPAMRVDFSPAKQASRLEKYRRRRRCQRLPPAPTEFQFYPPCAKKISQPASRASPLRYSTLHRSSYRPPPTDNTLPHIRLQY